MSQPYISLRRILVCKGTKVKVSGLSKTDMKMMMHAYSIKSNIPLINEAKKTFPPDLNINLLTRSQLITVISNANPYAEPMQMIIRLYPNLLLLGVPRKMPDLTSAVFKEMGTDRMDNLRIVDDAEDPRGKVIQTIKDYSNINMTWQEFLSKPDFNWDFIGVLAYPFRAKLKERAQKFTQSLAGRFKKFVITD